MMKSLHLTGHCVFRPCRFPLANVTLVLLTFRVLARLHPAEIGLRHLARGDQYCPMRKRKFAVRGIGKWWKPCCERELTGKHPNTSFSVFHAGCRDCVVCLSPDDLFGRLLSQEWVIFRRAHCAKSATEQPHDPILAINLSPWCSRRRRGLRRLLPFREGAKL